MGRRRWEKVGKSNVRKLVAVTEAPWSPESRTTRLSVEEEKIMAKAEEIRLRKSGFVVKANQSKEINSELLKGKVFYVDCQLDKSENKSKLLSRQEITGGIVSQLQKLGASISQSLSRKVNYIIFMNGRYSTFEYAQKKSIPLLSSGWIEESKKLDKLASTEKHEASYPSSFLDPVAPRKYKVIYLADGTVFLQDAELQRNYSLEHLEKLKKHGDKKKTKDLAEAQDVSKRSDKKPVRKETKETDTKSKRHSSEAKKKPSLVTSKKSINKPTSTLKLNHQENKSPSQSSNARKRRSSSVEVINVTPVKEKKGIFPVKVMPSPPKETTPIKRIRVESSCSPFATPPRDMRPKTELITVSNLTSEQYKTLSDAVAKLGRFQISRVAREGVTHVIWGSGRTINFLRAIALGCRIMSLSWVEESVKSGKWLPEDNFIAPAHKEIDKKIQYRKKTLGAFFNCQLLQDAGPMYVNSGVKSARPEDLRALIKLCGGTLVQNIQDARIVIGPPPDKLVLTRTAFVKENWIYSVVSSYQIKNCVPFVYD